MSNSNIWKYVQPEDTDITVREVDINTGKGGDDVVIVQLTDAHFNFCNENDLKNEVLASTHEGRKWLADGKSIPRAVKCIDYAETYKPDRIILTGDVLDYLSEGGMALVNEHVWNRLGDRVMITLGNHESTRHMQASESVSDPTTLDSRMEILQANWRHDIYYTSEVLGNKVMLITLDNGAANRFWSCQVEPLRADIARARENGYAVLIFYHIPMATADPADKRAVASMIGDKNGSVRNLCDCGASAYSDGATREVYEIITNSADVVKGCFCGHTHNDFYTEIVAKNADGTDNVIPQYVLIGTPYGHGNLLKITVK